MSEQQARALDQNTIKAVLSEVSFAKDRGWTQDDLRKWFGTEGVDVSTYKAALDGQEVPTNAAALFTQISITGMPDKAASPNRADIQKHIEWLIEPARGDFDDGLIEIAYEGHGRGPREARLFGLDEVAEAVDFAARQNSSGSNMYIGAALRLPDTARDGRTTAADFYVATAVPIDIDTDYDATRAKMAAVCDDGLVVTTGMTPTRRSQHWTRLVEPCDDAYEFGHAFAALVMHTGADKAVKDPARIMRLGGTVSYPNKDKLAAGYLVETTATTVQPHAKPSDIIRLQALEPSLEPIGSFKSRPAGGANGVERSWSGKIINGREAYFRDQLLTFLRAHHEAHDADPTEQELFDATFAHFSDPSIVNNEDERWTCATGRKELMHRTQNTMRRLKAGQLARFGLYSRTTGEGRDIALTVAANRVATLPKPEAEREPSRIMIETETARFTPRSFTGELPPPRPWAYGNFLMYRAVSAVAAPPGVGKTTFSFQVGIAFALDKELGPWAPAPGGGGKVWLYNGEEPQDELDRRFMAAAYESGVEDHVAAERFFYNSGLDERLQFVRVDPITKEIQRHPDVDLVKDIIKAQGIRLFIMDPLIEFNGATEDGEGFKAMGGVMREIANDCECSVLFFHHTPKASNSDTAAGDANALRGGGPLIGSARFVSTMFAMSVKDAEEYGVERSERHKYVRFDDAKANMTVMSGEPYWWVKLGVGLDNAEGPRPADNIGVLRHANLRRDGDNDSIERTMARATQKETTLDKIASEMARVCQSNGNTNPDKAESFDTLMRALDTIKTGVSVNSAKDMVIGGMGEGRISGEVRVVISSVPRGKLTVRKVHIEEVS